MMRVDTTREGTPTSQPAPSPTPPAVTTMPAPHLRVRYVSAAEASSMSMWSLVSVTLPTETCPDAPSCLLVGGLPPFGYCPEASTCTVTRRPRARGGNAHVGCRQLCTNGRCERRPARAICACVIEPHTDGPIGQDIDRERSASEDGRAVAMRRCFDRRAQGPGPPEAALLIGGVEAFRDASRR